jgi:hypothetical protein
MTKEAAYGPEHPEVAVTLDNLGLVLPTWSCWRPRHATNAQAIRQGGQSVANGNPRTRCISTSS